MTPLVVSIVASIASVALLLIVLELIRSRRLRERYALLWLATGVVLLVLSAWRSGLNTIADWVGVTGYPPAVLFAVAHVPGSGAKGLLTFFPGLLFGLLRLGTKSLWPAVAAHAAANVLWRRM